MIGTRFDRLVELVRRKGAYSGIVPFFIVHKKGILVVDFK